MGNIYVCSDLHGDYTLWRMVQEHLKESDTLFYLGDAIDRKSNGFKIIYEMMMDTRIKFILGNHEKMFLDAYRKGFNPLSQENILWFENGGRSSLNKFKHNFTKKEQQDIVNYLKNATDRESIVVNGKIFLLSHAGCAPKQIKNFFEIPTENSILLWDRNHFLYRNNYEKEFESIYIIHGHTPVHYLYRHGAINYKPLDKDPEIVFYDDGHKIDIDLASFYTDKVALLNLSEFKTIYFSSKGDIINE